MQPDAFSSAPHFGARHAVRDLSSIIASWHLALARQEPERRFLARRLAELK